MAIIRQKKMFAMETEAVQDKRLSLAARGLLALVTSLEKDKLDTDELIGFIPKNHQERSLSLITELVKYGYLTFGENKMEAE